MRPRTNLKSMGALLVALAALAALPAAAQAHGPVAPVASSYLARIGHAPAGIDAKVVDGDQRMWLRVAPGERVVVLDPRGAPYVRFDAGGVEVNRNSALFYLNQTPAAQNPPATLSASTPPSWQRVSGDREYGWHDGRLHALAAVALAPNASFAGVWRIPLIVNGTPAAISGGLWHAGNPSLAWFWPIAVILLCVLAAWRVREPALDVRVARTLAAIALCGTAVAAAGQELYGRPVVSAWQVVELAAILAFVAWGLRRVAFRPQGYFQYLLFAVVALWQGGVLVPTLLHGFVLMAIPAFVARAATVLCLGSGLSLLALVFRLQPAEPPPELDGTEEREDAWELA